MPIQIKAKGNLYKRNTHTEEKNTTLKGKKKAQNKKKHKKTINEEMVRKIKSRNGSKKFLLPFYSTLNNDVSFGT